MGQVVHTHLLGVKLSMRVFFLFSTIGKPLTIVTAIEFLRHFYLLAKVWGSKINAFMYFLHWKKKRRKLRHKLLFWDSLLIRTNQMRWKKKRDAAKKRETQTKRVISTFLFFEPRDFFPDIFFCLPVDKQAEWIRI